MSSEREGKRWSCYIMGDSKIKWFEGQKEVDSPLKKYYGTIHNSM